MIIIHVMNNSAYIHRYLEESLKQALESFPVVVLTGARQAGKSTLMQHIGKQHLYLLLYI